MDPIIQEQTSKEYFYKKVIRIGLPITLSQLLTSLLAFIDTYMVTGLGTSAVSAVGVSANFFFLMIMINFGMVSGLSIFFAQFWGSKDIKSIHKTFIVTIISAFAITSVFFLLAHFNSDFVIGLFNNANDPVARRELQEFGVNYIKIASFSYFFVTLSFTINMMMRSVEKVIFPQIVSIVVVVLNTIMNYLLIHGNLGFPALGVKGAAIATTISSFIGALIFITYMINTKHKVFRIDFSLYKTIDKEFLQRLFKKALPVTANETIWGLGMTMYVIAFSYISVDAMASYHISNQIMGMFWVVNAGISSACAVMLGNKLGEGNTEIAKNWGKRFVRLGFVAGVFLGITLFFSSGFISSLFGRNNDDIDTETVRMILLMFSFYVPIKFVNAIHIIGTLRSGGDTTFAFLAEAGALWTIGVPLAFILARFTNLPLYIVVGIVNLEELVKFFIVNIRFMQFKWVSNLTTT